MNSNLKLRWFEDFEVGQKFEFGAFEMTRQNMLDYARLYDPEPFHVDEEAAIALGWGGLIASGPQIVSVCRRLQKDGFPNAEVVISPGWDDIRWLKPVYAGDVLSARGEVVKVKTLSSREGEGAKSMKNDILNQKGDVVAQMTSVWFLRMRPAAL